METTSDITITKWLQGFDIPNQRYLHETKQTALNFSLIFKIYILIMKIVSQIWRMKSNKLLYTNFSEYYFMTKKKYNTEKVLVCLLWRQIPTPRDE